MPLKRPCRRARAPDESGVFESFPICPAGEVYPSKAVINGLKPRHSTLRLFQFCRWQVDR